MGYIKENLSTNESIINDIKLSKMSYFAPNFLVMLFVWLVLGSFGTFLGAAAALGIIFCIPIGWGVLKFYKTEQAVTDKKVIQKTGIISTTINEIRLNKLETVEFSRGVLGRIFGYGTVKVTGTGGSELSMYGVSNPKEVKNQIDNLID